MRTLWKAPNIDFMSKRRIAVLLSLALIAASIVSLATRGLNFGIDFTGGTLIELGYQDTPNLDELRRTLADAGFPDAVVQTFGTLQDVLIRLVPSGEVSNAEISSRVLDAVGGDAAGGPTMRRVEFVGPQVGEELTEQGGLAMLYALFGILVYVAVRFERRFALGAVAALIHDVILVLGVFSWTQLNFDLPVLAAVLAVIGYSLNDTIVVFDRIRENFRKIRRGESRTVVNSSLNQTLARTIVTGLTTLLVLIALFLFGGELIHSFAIALIIGIVVGTYSSIYIASAALLAMGVTRQDLMPVAKEGGEQEASP